MPKKTPEPETEPITAEVTEVPEVETMPLSICVKIFNIVDAESGATWRLQVGTEEDGSLELVFRNLLGGTIAPVVKTLNPTTAKVSVPLTRKVKQISMLDLSNGG